MQIAELPGRGRGWVAKQEVHKGEVLVSVPREATIEVPMDEDMEEWEAEMGLELLRMRPNKQHQRREKSSDPSGTFWVYRVVYVFNRCGFS